MKYLLTIALVFSFFMDSFSQENLSVPLIEVEGMSKRKIAPDEAVFSINLEEKSMKVKSAIDILNQKTENLSEELKKAKIKDFKLIADNYSVDINRIYRGGVSRDSGYVARQRLKIVSISNNEDLQKIVEAIQDAGDMSFNLNFQVSELKRNSLEDEMLTEALKNAESRARLIAETLGIRSIVVHRVSLSAPQQIFPKMEMMRTSADASSNALISPDEQTIQRTVYVKYTY